MIGKRLAHYEITEHLGSGGMGEVYQATDSRLGRSVAIKLLPEAFSSDSERVARFQREARVLASLNHPHIGGIHGIEESSGRLFLVLELVSGETLADRIARGPIPLDETVTIATQIAEALEVAHDAGIIHRDLKPANIKLTVDGQVKVLDFGLAKALSNEEPMSEATHSPTMSLAATQRGVILGTAAYMAPEQARGRAADRRADIWAFGVVLYEMVTGRRLFQGEDLTDTLAAVVREKPDYSAAPAALRPVLEKCLEKDPKKRLRHISAFPLLLQQATPETVAATPIETKQKPPRLAWALSALLALGLASLAAIHFRETSVRPQAVQFFLEPPGTTTFINQYGGFAVSPDGRFIVFTARGEGTPQLWLRPLDSNTPRPLPGTENGNFPTWSPDSKSLVFYAQGKMKRIEIAGGAPLTLGDGSEGAVTPTGTWNSSGVILIGSGTGLMRVSASGGGATPLTKVDSRTESGHGYPQFLPDEDRFIYFIASSNSDVQGIYASSLSQPDKRQQILRSAAKAVFVPGGGIYPSYLLWMQEQTLLAQEFDPETLQMKGDPVSVAEQIGLNPTVPVRAAFWASDAGSLIYFALPSQRKRAVAWIGRDAKLLGEAAPEDAFTRVALAPGEDRVALARTDGASQPPNLDIWVREFKRGVMTRLTFNAAADDVPVWSPDGKQIAFSSNRVGNLAQIFRKDVSGSGEEEQLTHGENPKLPLDWSEDGRYLLYREQNPRTGRDLMVLPLEGERKPIPVANTEFLESTGAISPDGRWIAYVSNDSSTNQVYVRAFPGLGGPSGQWQVSNGSAYELKWRIDGKEIYYQTQDGKVMAVAIQAGPDGIRAESPRELFKADFQVGSLHEFDASADGQRFLMILNRAQNNTEDERLTVISNWQAVLRK